MRWTPNINNLKVSNMLSFDAQHFPYASRRNVVYAQRGMVATSQPLAAQAGLQVLQAGGNAIDAAIATAAALSVLEPTANGIGGDAFALVWHGGKLHGLNASGPASANSTLESFTKLGHTEMPKYGPLAVTVPGTPASWVAMAQRFGKLPLTTSMAAAIGYARDGFAVSPSVAYAWQQATKVFHQQLKGEHFKSWFDTFAPERPPGRQNLALQRPCPNLVIDRRDQRRELLPWPLDRAHRFVCAAGRGLPQRARPGRFQGGLV